MTDSEMADDFSEKLSEHFDSVIIICTTTEGNGTRVVCKRRGNYYATKGAMVEWLEEERNRDLAQKLQPESDD